MKAEIVVLSLVVVFAAVAMACGPQPDSGAPSPTRVRIDPGIGPYASVTVVNVDGHQYVVAGSTHGLAIVHAESCSCNEPSKKGSAR